MALVVTGTPSPDKIKSFLKTVCEIKDKIDFNIQKKHNEESK